MPTEKTQQNSQIAKFNGIYRCTGLGQTKAMEEGEMLPLCSCPGGGCKWEFILEDNILHKDPIVVFVGEGIFHTIEMDELPEIGMILNLKSSWKNSQIKAGQYRITKVGEIMWRLKNYFHILVERTGDIPVDTPIHNAMPMNC